MNQVSQSTSLHPDILSLGCADRDEHSWAVDDQDEEFVFPKFPKFSPAKKNLVQQGEGASHQPAIYKFLNCFCFI